MLALEHAFGDVHLRLVRGTTTTATVCFASICHGNVNARNDDAALVHTSEFQSALDLGVVRHFVHFELRLAQTLCVVRHVEIEHGEVDDLRTAVVDDNVVGFIPLGIQSTVDDLRSDVLVYRFDVNIRVGAENICL